MFSLPFNPNPNLNMSAHPSMAAIIVHRDRVKYGKFFIVVSQFYELI